MSQACKQSFGVPHEILTRLSVRCFVVPVTFFRATNDDILRPRKNITIATEKVLQVWLRSEAHNLAFDREHVSVIEELARAEAGAIDNDSLGQVAKI